MELLLPLVLVIGVMLLMTRSAKNKQRQLEDMRNSIEPGTGIRTIGGMYALVKEVRHDTLLLELEPGMHAVFSKQAVSAILEADEYHRIVNGETDPEDLEDDDSPEVPDDASSLTEGDREPEESGIDLGKRAPADKEPGDDSKHDGEGGKS
ncbi:preprotein translocase subunit YajC [Streptomyces aidingensis]|uniref:Preprotein translocase subunit YajC n=1 Tax=Streptomyces aidingensis TaxID=910347 RepID=A0A1I1RTP8_9ACTN|nr:preprotein translocase subunit YajC [Streptomyces aidingensis]SFD37611.1 preprotein translocase subunit YajC [Streptomyces aidingensis]